MNKNRRGPFAAAALLTVSLLLAACGGSTATPLPTATFTVPAAVVTASPAARISPTPIKSMPAPVGTAGTGSGSVPPPISTAGTDMLPTPAQTGEPQPDLANPQATP